MTALIVDDELAMRVLARLTLETSGGRIEVVGEARSGKEGIEAWRRLRPSVILMDNRMPDMSGLEAAQQILQEDPDQRIILFSAFLDDNVRESARAVGITEFLSKNEAHLLPDLILAGR